MFKSKILPLLKKYFYITVGSLVYAASVSLFADPNELAPGGVSGIAIILNHVFGFLSVGMLILIINIPIMVLGMIKFGFRFLISTTYTVVVSSLFMDLMTKYIGAATHDMFLASVMGGILMAIGIGMIFRAGATTGGTDIIVKLIHSKYRYMKTGNLFFAIDVIIITVSGFVFHKVESALYAGVTVLVYMLVINMVLYGGDEARLVYIISPCKDKITERIMKELDSGVTVLKGKGAYTGDDREVLMCVLRMKALPEARDIVREEDKNAFMVVTQATSVFGEGYKSHDTEDL
ncbi:MAG: YitT family protein [Clostridia bacterium]|nr:YitT family protein [Clostridia bacterium]